MPYVTCSRCDTTAYSAARFTTVDHCPLCGERLPQGTIRRLPVTRPQWAVTAAAPGEEQLRTTATAASAP
jgi:hypothetical protein